MKVRIVLLVLVLALVAAACGGDEGDGGDGAAVENPERIAYLINGSLGDQSFYDSGQVGIDRLEEDFGLETRTIENGFDNAKFEASLQAAVNYADLIFVISYGFEDLLIRYAEDNPDKLFVNIDTVVEAGTGNIVSIDYLEEEGAYLAGVLAASLTTDESVEGTNPDPAIGAVAGDESPAIKAFTDAYTVGAKSVSDDIEVEIVTIGTFEDSGKGKQAALQLYDGGADIVFQIAAAAGLGVLEAAEERGLYAIGVDSNQNPLQPGHVVASEIKDVGRSIYEAHERAIGDGFDDSEILTPGLEEGIIDLTFDDNEDVVPQEIVDQVGQARQGIIDGDIAVTG